MLRIRSVTVGFVFGLAVASVAAAGAVTTKLVTLPTRGDAAIFTPSYWVCTNHGTSVSCGTGDAYPWATLMSSKKLGVEVVVHTLAGKQAGKIAKLTAHGQTSYTFSSFATTVHP